MCHNCPAGNGTRHCRTCGATITFPDPKWVVAPYAERDFSDRYRCYHCGDTFGGPMPSIRPTDIEPPNGDAPEDILDD